MAFTATQKANIRLYAGWAGAGFQVDTRLEGAISAIESSASHEAQVIALLTSLATIDADLLSAHARLKASEVGSIKLNSSEIAVRRAEGRRLVGRLCSILGVPRKSDVFGSGAAGSNYVGK